MPPELIARIRAGMFQRDPVSQLAHIFGRFADMARFHPVSVTAIQREEAAKRAFRQRWGIDYDQWLRSQR